MPRMAMEPCQTPIAGTWRKPSVNHGKSHNTLPLLQNTDFWCAGGRRKGILDLFNHRYLPGRLSMEAVYIALATIVET